MYSIYLHIYNVYNSIFVLSCFEWTNYEFTQPQTHSCYNITTIVRKMRVPYDYVYEFKVYSCCQGVTNRYDIFSNNVKDYY